ncbi:P-loop containing nucleoside triphosphate hydrolase protein [Phellopilus nigrolimitatus]|nr:P-loop containing nucleoside triphosphate hydrolase protein [Phellopilus nigrolimitatus]
MRRPGLTVDTDVSNDKAYELTQRHSIGSSHSSSRTIKVSVDVKDSRTTIASPEVGSPASTLQQSLPSSTHTAPVPSIRLLYSLVSRHDALMLLLPAVLTSVIAGGVAPFMTVVVGQVFDAFARFPLSGASAEDKAALRSSIGLSAIELVALAVGAIALSSVTSALWISTGERNVYEAVSTREMEWFDTKMGAEDAIISTEAEGPIGAGGLMAKFNRDTDDVRMATSLASGMLVQYLTTCITCLILAFRGSWALTLVILSAVPALMIIQVFSQGAAGPLINAEREQTAVAATFVERAINAIATIKAFNAQAAEQALLGAILDKMKATTIKVNGVFGFSSAFSQFASMGMFVQGFWFGAKLVRDGTVTAGDVMAVFWACLIAASNLQMCIPQFITLAKGKFAMVSLVTLIDPAPPPTPVVSTFRMTSVSASSNLTLLPVTSSKGPSSKRVLPQVLRKITPGVATGSSRSTMSPSRILRGRRSQVLKDAYIFFPANETTFVVGGSGSGKSTIAQLLARLYAPTAGTIQLDDQDTAYIDEHWLRTHVAVVSQSCILFEGSVHHNVAMGVAGLKRRPEDVTRQEVISACTASLMHDFVRDLPDGYETKLGAGGASLSGGQKQRLAIARAMLRDPTVLILDEATSALDATSRVLVFEAIKAWRTNKTTIVITHDLSQITAEDFVYVLKDGYVVEQGYRGDLEGDLEEAGPEGNEGEFRKMMYAQGAAGGFPMKRDSEIYEDAPADSAVVGDYVECILDQANAENEKEIGKENKRLTVVGIPAQGTNHQSVSLSGWMLDVVQDLTRSRSMATTAAANCESKHLSLNPTPKLGKRKSFATLGRKKSRRSTQRKHSSLQLTPTSPSAVVPPLPSAFVPAADVEDDEDFEYEKAAMERSGMEANRRRIRRAAGERVHWSDFSLDGIMVEAPTEETASFIQLVRDVYPTIPNKAVILLGVIVCLLSGAMTPIFSFLLSRLLFEVSTGATNVHAINVFGGIVLAMAATDGFLIGLKFFIMESGAMVWITKLRKDCYARLLAQDKKFFDRTDNSAVRLVQILVKDGDDAHNLIATVLSQCVVVSTMLSVGLIWALVSGWQLTLAGLAIGPVFAVTMSVQANLVGRAERKNKLAREEIAKGYYECISNIRAIRCMSFEAVFREQFESSVSRAYATGVKGAFIEGCSFGVANGLIYLAEALLFFVGAVLVANGTYTYLQMVEVLNLVVFTVTIGSQLMGFTQKIAKATQATRDLNKILALSTDTDESRGSAMPPVEGDIKFKNVNFFYPERPEVPVLQETSLKLRRNECVAVVGSSGSGKSTVAALLQRLYEPTSGLVTIGGNDVSTMDVKHLRTHISVVSQSPNLFDATVAENISYGNPTLSAEDVRHAAQAAHIHDFIMSLPQGYNTPVGENAALISGGQAQRLAIARALARPAHVLVLDECTSALDPASQAAVMDTIRSAKVGRTTVIVTHKLPVMQLCDRIVVIADGAVAEEGSFNELMRTNGVFAQLARGGEWSSE